MFSSITLRTLLVLSLYHHVTLADIIITLRHHPHLMPEDRFKDRAASFGAELPYSLKGLAVYADPPDGCHNITKPPKVTNNEKWIAVMQRYNCSFEQKVRMAQNASYDAVIIHNVGSNELEVMSAKNAFGIVIPSVFVGMDTGMAIKNNYQWNSDFYVKITADDFVDINKILLPFAIVVGMCFSITLIIMIIRFIKERLRQQRYRLPYSSLNKIPTCKFAKGDPYDTCAICLDDYVEGEKLRILPCAHAYHSKCIDPWLTKNRRVCPICKRKVFAHDEQHIPDSDSDSDADDTTPLVNPVNRSNHGTFARQTENPFQRAARSVSQIGDEQGYQNEGMFVTASGDHSINTETTDNVSLQSSTNAIIEQPSNVVEVFPDNNNQVNNNNNNNNNNAFNGRPDPDRDLVV